MEQDQKQPDIAYRSEHIFNQGKDGFLGGAKNPYRNCNDYRRDDWEAGFLYQQRLYYKLLMESEGKDFDF
jgi:hypothetical protein